MMKHHSAHYYKSQFIYILFSENKKLFKHQTYKLLTDKNNLVSCKIFLEMNVIFCIMFGHSQNTLIRLPYTNYIIILKQPTKAHIPVSFIDTPENITITDTFARFQWKQTALK